MNECPNVFALFLFSDSKMEQVFCKRPLPKVPTCHIIQKCHIYSSDELVIKMPFIMLTPVRLIARIALNFYQIFR
ncbi:MAG: hypothetical protein Kow0080_16580 [Candidatus Promineifilaceae bacterium]